MSNDYKKFFKAAKQKKQPLTESNTKPQSSTIKNNKIKKDQTAEQYLREALKMKEPSKKKSGSGFPVFMILMLIVIGTSGYFGYLNKDLVVRTISRFNVSFFGQTLAQNRTETPANVAQAEGQNAVTTAGEGINKNAAGCVEMKGFSQEELSHFNKLNERKLQLDARERDLVLLEEELHKQKAEIETRIGKLEQIRDEVATVLKDRVEIDQVRVGTLVDFYSNMKPQQAAEIIGKLNEDLAVEVLGKMKKKNAADILNLVEPVKARTLSEKFTGYVRR